MSGLKLCKLLFGVLFFCHLIGCCSYFISASQAPWVFGMFRPPDWWGCELPVQNTTTGYADDYAGSPVVTADSVFKELDGIEVELLTGLPIAPGGDLFCDDGRWVAKIYKGWLYMWVLYWTITTMTTIGYGDFSPVTPLEVGLTIVVELFGAVLFGWIIGNIATLIAEFNQHETAYKLRMEQVKNYLVHKRIPSAMKKRVRKFCAHYYMVKGVMREHWEFLPPRLRRDLLNWEHIEFYTVFERLNLAGCDDVRQRLAEMVRPFVCLAGEYYALGSADPCAEVGFVFEGELLVLPKLHAPSKAEMVAKGLTIAPNAPSSEVEKAAKSTMPRSPSASTLGVKRPGSWLGHVELLSAYEETRETGNEQAMLADIAWNHTYKARVRTEMFLLVKDEFFMLVDEFPYLRDMLETEPEVELGNHTRSPTSRRRTTNAQSRRDSWVSDYSERDSTASVAGLGASRLGGSAISHTVLSPIPPSPIDSSTTSRLHAGEASAESDAAEAEALQVTSVEARRVAQADTEDAVREHVREDLRERTSEVTRRVEERRSSCKPHKHLTCSCTAASGGGGGCSSAGKTVGLGAKGASVKTSPNRQMMQQQQGGAGAGGPSWKQLRQRRGSAVGNAAGTPAERAEGEKSSFFKQRVALEILGDGLKPASEIDEDDLFQRLSARLAKEAAAADGRPPPVVTERAKA